MPSPSATASKRTFRADSRSANAADRELFTEAFTVAGRARLNADETVELAKRIVALVKEARAAGAEIAPIDPSESVGFEC